MLSAYDAFDAKELRDLVTSVFDLWPRSLAMYNAHCLAISTKFPCVEMTRE